MIWTAIIATSVIVFALKYLGQAVPATWLANARIQKFALHLPTALLAALVAVQTLGIEKNIVFDDGTHLTEPSDDALTAKLESLNLI